MHATLRRMRCAPGQATEVGRLMKANELAQSWARERLASLGAAPLEAFDGEVLVHTIYPA